MQKPQESMERYRLESVEKTISFGIDLGTRLSPGAIICLFGDLGAGKTTLIKGIIEGAIGCRNEEVRSPTFVYLSVYEGPITVYHFDLYRLRDMNEFLDNGFDEMLFSDGICCIEWSERIEQLLPPEAQRILLFHAEPGEDDTIRYVTLL